MNNEIIKILKKSFDILNKEFTVSKSKLDLECDYANIEELIRRGYDYLKYSNADELENKLISAYIETINLCYNAKKAIEIIRDVFRNNRDIEDFDLLEQNIDNLESIFDQLKNNKIVPDNIDKFIISSECDILLLKAVLKNKKEDSDQK